MSPSRPIPRLVWLPVLFAGAVCAVVTVAALWTIRNLERSLDRELGERLQAVAVGASTALDSGKLLDLAVEGPDGLTYGRLALDFELVRSSAKANDVFVVDRDGRVLLDLVREAAVGHSSPVFAAERVAATSALAGVPSATGVYRTGEFLFKTGFAPIRGAAGDVRGVVGVEAGADFLRILDETRRHLALALLPAMIAVFLLSLLFVRLSLARQRLEREFARAENLAAVGELAATLAHEVRNPLGIIKRSAERLKRQYSGSEPELLDYVSEECDRLAGTVRRYLDFARPAQAERFGNAMEAASATVHLLEPECRERRIQLTYEVRGDGPWRVTLGGEQIKQALLNLLRNGLEAFADEQGEPPEGAQPALATREKQRRLAVRLARSGRSVALSVFDNGPGMDAETVRRAREPFFTTRVQGSGLGLAIIDRMTRESGGQMRIDSSRGRGTTITLFLRPAPEETKVMRPPDVAAAGGEA